MTLLLAITTHGSGGSTGSADPEMILESWYTLYYSFINFHPTYHLAFEIALLLGVIWLVFRRSYKPADRTALSAREQQELIDEWKPEPLVPRDFQPNPAIQDRFDRLLIQGRVGKHVIMLDCRPAAAPTDGNSAVVEAEDDDDDDVRTTTDHNSQQMVLLNLASFNYLNLIGDAEMDAEAKRTLRRYGVGSCGPRGFYGTFDVHLRLERALASLLRVEDAIVYSYGFSTVASAIPAYSKRTDVVFADEAVSFAVQCGLSASRSKLVWFRHNDMRDLRIKLEQFDAERRANPKKARLTRSFIVVEGLYLNRGDTCPLDRLVHLKYEFKVRLIVDETHSFGVLGAMGRGITEYCQVDIADIDLLTGSLETALGCAGGWSAGSKYVVDHQRLSGQGYCFSASLPPLLASAAHVGIDKIARGDIDYAAYRALCLRVHHMLTCELAARETDEVSRYWSTQADPISPIKHLRLRAPQPLGGSQKEAQLEAQMAVLERAVEMARGLGVLLTVARYLPQFEIVPEIAQPSIRLSINRALDWPDEPSQEAGEEERQRKEMGEKGEKKNGKDVEKLRSVLIEVGRILSVVTSSEDSAESSSSSLSFNCTVEA